MPAEWSGVLNTTIRNYIKDREQDTLRNRKLLAKAQANGNVSYGWSGDQVEWRIEYKRQNIQGMADADTLTFPRIDRFKKANLDWRGYAATDSVTKKEKLMNAGPQAIINRYTEITNLLMTDIEENFSQELYVDGNASGNDKRIHGLESFFGIATAAVTGITAAGEIIGTPLLAPSDTYANLNTDLGYYGGSWTPALGAAGPWPAGYGSPEFDFYSPLIMDITSTLAAGSGGWASATATFAARGLEITRYGIIKSKKNQTKRGQIDTVLMSDDYFRQFLALMQPEERILVKTGNAPQGSLASLGFTDVVNFDGVEITYEFGMPSNTMYGFNTSNFEIRSLQKQLFVPEGPDFDIASQSWRFSIDFYGNTVFRPRYYFKGYQVGLDGA